MNKDLVYSFFITFVIWVLISTLICERPFWTTFAWWSISFFITFMGGFVSFLFVGVMEDEDERGGMR